MLRHTSIDHHLATSKFEDIWEPKVEFCLLLDGAILYFAG